MYRAACEYMKKSEINNVKYRKYRENKLANTFWKNVLEIKHFWNRGASDVIGALQRWCLTLNEINIRVLRVLTSVKIANQGSSKNPIQISVVPLI